MTLWNFVTMPCIAFKFEILTLGHLIVSKCFKTYSSTIFEPTSLIRWLCNTLLQLFKKEREQMAGSRVVQGGINDDVRARLCSHAALPPVPFQTVVAAETSTDAALFFSALHCDCLNDFHQRLYSFLRFNQYDRL